MTKTRGFETVKNAPETAVIPTRATKTAAGYDFVASETVVIPTGTKIPVFVKTGIKAYMQEDEFLAIYNRSGNPLKDKGLILTNGVGVVDSDYYGNPKNDGEIMGQFINIGTSNYTIQAGDRVFQGVFQKFLTADGDEDVKKAERSGGHGSTGTKTITREESEAKTATKSKTKPKTDKSK